MTTETSTISTSLKGLSQGLSGFTQVSSVPQWGGMLPAFSSPEDIANRALQHLGQTRILSWSENSKAAESIRFAYTKLLQAELRRNTWTFATRRAVIRAASPTTRMWQPPVWSPVFEYELGSVVQYTDIYNRTLLWISTSGNNTGQVPIANQSPWVQYFGAVCGDLWNPQNQTPPQAYVVGDVVYQNPQPGYFYFYISTQNNNSDNPVVADVWSSTVTYPGDAVVYWNGFNYISLADDNLNLMPGTLPTAWAITNEYMSWQWTALGGFSAPLNIMYPAEVGPISYTFTKAMFPLPAGFLRSCNQDPKAGSYSLLGAPTNSRYLDWLIEGNFIVTQDPNPIILRFVADVQDIIQMDPMFCEGLACRIGFELCEEITQSSEKINVITRTYLKMMTEARLVNAIEVGSEESPLDDWIACRM